MYIFIIGVFPIQLSITEMTLYIYRMAVQGEQNQDKPDGEKYEYFSPNIRHLLYPLLYLTHSGQPSVSVRGGYVGDKQTTT